MRRQSRTQPGAAQARPAQAAPAQAPIQADDLARRRREAEQRRARAQAERLRKQQDDARRLQDQARRQRAQAEARQRQASQDPHYADEHETVHRLVEDAGEAAMAKSTRRENAMEEHRLRIKRRLANRQELRDLFILKELLDPPVAMRDGPPGNLISTRFPVRSTQIATRSSLYSRPAREGDLGGAPRVPVDPSHMSRHARCRQLSPRPSREEAAAR